VTVPTAEEAEASAPPPEERAEPKVGLSRTAAGRVVPLAVQRAYRRMDDAFIGWFASIAVTLLALFLRLWRLGEPHAFMFDETYYAKDAWSMANFGYVRSYQDGANDAILGGHTSGQWTDTPSLIVHPEVGKWLIAAGEKAFGMDPFGWRVSAAVVGSLMVLVMCRLVRRMTGSTLLGCVAGLLLGFDGLHLVLSRMALLDIFVAFFMLLGVHAIVADRDWFRRRMASQVGPTGTVEHGWGPVRSMLWRPWLFWAGIVFGLAVGTKWAALYPLAAFGAMAWLWSAGARRSFGVRAATLRSVVVDGIPAFFQLVVVALLVYAASWTGWLVHAHAYEEAWSSTQYTRFVSWDGKCDTEKEELLDVKYNDDRWPTATEKDATGLGEVVQSLRSLWYYHQDVYTFHRYFLDCSQHDYASNPAGWLLLNRPVGADAQLDIQPGEQGCNAAEGSDCLRQVLILGNPTLWWGSVLALIASAALWVGARDWRYGVAVVGTLVTWLPWLGNDDRPIFSFYAILTLPFLVLASTLVMGRMIGDAADPTRSPARRTAGVVVSGTFVVLVLVNFAFFWPIWTDGLLTHREWLQRIWFDRWI
jgi:dolichyl-phosphate-mannose-protein mannosyltransferase